MTHIYHSSWSRCLPHRPLPQMKTLHCTEVKGNKAPTANIAPSREVVGANLSLNGAASLLYSCAEFPRTDVRSGVIACRSSSSDKPGLWTRPKSGRTLENNLLECGIEHGQCTHVALPLQHRKWVRGVPANVPIPLTARKLDTLLAREVREYLFESYFPPLHGIDTAQPAERATVEVKS